MEIGSDSTNREIQTVDQDIKRAEEVRRQEQKADDKAAETRRTEENAAYILELSRSQEATAKPQQYDSSGNLVE